MLQGFTIMLQGFNIRLSGFNIKLRFTFVLGASSLQKNGKKNDIVHLSNYPHPPGLIVTAERMTNHIN